MVEAAEGPHQLVELALAGMAEGRVAEVMGQRQRLGQVLVEAQRPGDRAGDLRHLDRVGEPRAVVIALVIDEDLGLVLQPPEGLAMDDPVAVAGEGRAEVRFRSREHRAPALLREGGEGCREPLHGTPSENPLTSRRSTTTYTIMTTAITLTERAATPHPRHSGARAGQERAPDRGERGRLLRVPV